MNFCALMMGLWNAAATMENSMVAPQKIKNRTTIWFGNSTSGCIPERTESRYLKRYLYIHAYSSIIHNSQKVEATQVSTDRSMGKENVVNTYNGILFSLKIFSLKKEENSDTCYNTNEPWKHYTKWMK